MCSPLTPDQNNLIKKIAEAESLDDYEIEVNSTSVKGDGYLGIISNVNLITENRKLNFILKRAETSQALRKQVPIRKAYLREIYLYKTILPEFQKFQNKYDIQDGFRAFAKIYGSGEEDGNEYLLLENLKEDGYLMWNRHVPMNSEHVELVFSNYGKLHGISLAMRDKDPELFQELTKDMSDIFMDGYNKEEFEYMIKLTLDNGFKAVEGDNFATEAIKRFQDIASTFFLEELHMPEDHLVVIHGDCWCNNVMFKYEDIQNLQKPMNICVIDWQLSKIGTPILDLAYFFFVCSPKEILYDYEKYLKIYHEAVSNILKKFACNPEEIFPYSLLERHWMKYAKFGLYMAIMVIKLMLSEVDEIPVFNEKVEAGESLLDCLNYDSVHGNDYNQRISDVVTFMAQNGLV